MRNIRISLHLLFLMIQISCFSALVSIVVYYLWIYLDVYVNTDSTTENPYSLTLMDWLQFAVSTILSLIVAVYIAAGFAKRLLQPLESLADSAKKIANGELNARAVASDRRFAETTALLDNFNSMAERLENASKEIRTWNAIIAHELRTPVTILQGRLQGLADGVFIPDNAFYLNLVRQTENLSRLIDDLRTLSLSENGYLSLHRTNVDMGQEILAVTELMRPYFVEKKMILTSYIDAVTLNCDPTRIRQALLALLDNALRYSTPGIVLITCKNTQDFVEIMVEDEGPGVQKEHELFIFDVFIRGNNSLNRKNRGTGLGLAVVKAIVQAHNGQVICNQSHLGGAAFIMYFPNETSANHE